MKAAIIKEHGPLECLEISERPSPRVGESEVLLQVHAAALNHLDIWVRRGRPGLTLEMPHILGSDAAGVVVETGSAVQGVNVGDEVILNPGLSCGACERCLGGQQSECVSFGIVGMTRPGTFAEQVAVPFQNVLPKPGHLSFAEAAALPLAYQTAWRMLMARARLRPGEVVLINGIGSGVALAALQLAQVAGAGVIATSSSDEKLARAKALGAGHTINYRSVQDVAGAVQEITGGRGVDIVFDTAGAGTWNANFQAVRRGGRIVLCGITTGAEAPTNLQMLYWNQLTILGSTMGSDDDCRQMLKTVCMTRLKPVVDSVVPFEDIRGAMERMETGQQFGKIVIGISRSDF